jgi:hypothetical protein
MRTAAPAALLALALLASGCGGSGSTANDAVEPSGDASSSAPPSTDPGPTDPSSTASESDAPTATATPESFPGGLTTRDGGQGSGNGLGLAGVRVGAHEGYDRVVFELGGTGTPGYRVEYVDQPVADGSGDSVPLKGTAYLQVVLRGLGMPEDTGVPAYGTYKTRVRGAGGIAEVAPGSVFEGEQQAFIGLTGGRRPFRVSVLSDPARVVVDVRTD